MPSIIVFGQEVVAPRGGWNRRSAVGHHWRGSFKLKLKLVSLICNMHAYFKLKLKLACPRAAGGRPPSSPRLRLRLRAVRRDATRGVGRPASHACAQVGRGGPGGGPSQSWSRPCAGPCRASAAGWRVGRLPRRWRRVRRRCLARGPDHQPRSIDPGGNQREVAPRVQPVRRSAWPELVGQRDSTNRLRERLGRCTSSHWQVGPRPNCARARATCACRAPTQPPSASHGARRGRTACIGDAEAARSAAVRPATTASPASSRRWPAASPASAPASSAARATTASPAATSGCGSRCARACHVGAISVTG